MADEKTKIVELAKQQNDYMQRRFSTKYSQYKYKVEQTRSLHHFTYALIWIYFLFSVFYLGIIFVGPKRNKFSNQYKFIVLCIIVVFPYIITPVEYFIIRGVTFLIETVAGNVFKRDDHEYVVDYNAIPNLFSY